MDYLFHVGLALLVLVLWVLLSGLWSMVALRRAERFDYHADLFFKYASCLMESEAMKPPLARLVLLLARALSDDTAARQFFFIFAWPSAQNRGNSSHFDREIQNLPQDLIENLLKSVLHALLAISYQNWLFGLLFRALIASMIYDRTHQTQLAGLVYSSDEKVFKTSSLVFHH